ncbi:MAG: CPBP family intramembrane metalloprotease [Clostridiales bacterium]|nr:CPBP family intramembrane metalloprotease [Candidatus Cacconaster stercorequi]
MSYKSKNALMIFSCLSAMPLAILLNTVIVGRLIPKAEDDYVTLIYYTILFVIAISLYYRVIVDDYYKEKDFFHFCLKSIIIAVIILALNVLSSFAFHCFWPSISSLNEESILNMQIVPHIFLPVFAGPVVEEIVFRYILQRWLEKTMGKHGQWLSIYITGLIFSFFHSGFALDILVYIVPSIFICWAYKRTDNLSMMIFAHMINNFLATVL